VTMNTSPSVGNLSCIH